MPQRWSGLAAAVLGAHERAYYERFWCTIHLSSWASRYEATKKITVRPTGSTTFVVKDG
jgi:hypothetical protein